MFDDPPPYSLFANGRSFFLSLTAQKCLSVKDHSIFENMAASSERSGSIQRQVHAKWRSDEACRAPRGSWSKAPAILLTPSISNRPCHPFSMVWHSLLGGPGMRPRYSNGVSGCITRLLVAKRRDNLIFIGDPCWHSQNAPLTTDQPFSPCPRRIRVQKVKYLSWLKCHSVRICARIVGA